MIADADETMFHRSFKRSHIKNPYDPDARREAFLEWFGRYPFEHGKENHAVNTATNKPLHSLPEIVLPERCLL